MVLLESICSRNKGKIYKQIILKKGMIDIVQEKFPKMAQDITPFTSFYIFFYSAVSLQQ
jgi:hypothetical protein